MEQTKETYQAALYTQLIIHGLAHGLAAEKSKEAADFLEMKKLPYPAIVVG